MRHISIAAALTCLCAGPAFAQGLSAELFGGLTLGRSLEFNGAMPEFDSAGSFGIRGLYNVTPSLAVGLEHSRNETDRTGFVSALGAETTMLIARYEMPVTDQFSGYATLGYGQTELGYFDGAITDYDNVSSGQIALGGHYAFNETVGAFAEISHHRAFEEANIDGNIVDYHATSVNVGVRFRF